MANLKHPMHKILKEINRDSCPHKINLHCHTNNSDGSLSPMDLFKQANDLGIEHLAITDHHSISAYIEIQNYIETNCKVKFTTKLWSGIEISALVNGCLVHILGYGFDVSSKWLEPYATGDSVKGSLLNASSVIYALKKSNGFSFLAHPARYRLPFSLLIKEAKSIGFDGVETWYDYDRSFEWKPTKYTCDQIYNEIKQYNLLSSCGTDTHGISLLKR